MRRLVILIGGLAVVVALGACGAEMATVVVTEPVEPGPLETESPGTATPLATPTAQPTAAPTPVVEERVAEVEWPESMRVRDGEVVRLSLLAEAAAEAVGTPEVAGHEVASETLEMPVERAGYAGTVSASLTAAGLEVTEAGSVEQALAPGRGNTWRWTVSAPRAGTYHPVINVTVRWEPLEGGEAGRVVEEAVWSRVLTVRARGVLGLSGPQADWLGVGGSALGTVASLPFLEQALRAVWRRVRGQGRRRDG